MGHELTVFIDESHGQCDNVLRTQNESTENQEANNMNQLDKWLRKLEDHEKEEDPPVEVANMPTGDYEALLEEINHR